MDNKMKFILKELIDNNGKIFRDKFSMDSIMLIEAFKRGDFPLIQEAMREIPLGFWLTFRYDNNRVIVDKFDGIIFHSKGYLEDEDVHISIPPYGINENIMDLNDDDDAKKRLERFYKLYLNTELYHLP